MAIDAARRRSYDGSVWRFADRQALAGICSPFTIGRF
jgi:hypothetical protein